MKTDSRNALVEESWYRAHPKEKGVDFLSDLGEADRVNARPPEVGGVKILVDLSTWFALHKGDWVGTDGSSLLRHALGLGQGSPVW